MADQKQRQYPQLGGIIHAQADRAIRVLHDMTYDLQDALGQMTGGATAQSFVASGHVTSIMVMYPGFGYAEPPKVTLTGGGGTGATAVATINAGRVVSVKITAQGTGYTSAPSVEFSQ